MFYNYFMCCIHDTSEYQMNTLNFTSQLVPIQFILTQHKLTQFVYIYFFNTKSGALIKMGNNKKKQIQNIKLSVNIKKRIGSCAVMSDIIVPSRKYT